jgi:hypothetical protein
MPIQLSGSLLMSGSITATGLIDAQGGITSTGTQHITDTTNPVSFTSTASLYTEGGVRIKKDMYVSGTAYFNNVTIYGTQSVNYITSSQLNIGTNIITVNTDTPTVRFGGLAVYDSGSTGLTGSLLWDSEDNHWIYSNPSGSTYSGGMLISGPRAAALGSEQGTTSCMLLAGQGGDHLTSSAIYHSSTVTCIPNTLAGGVGCFSGAVCSPTFVGGTVSGTTGTFTSTVIAGNGSSQTEIRINSSGGNNEGPFLRLQKGGANIAYVGAYSSIVSGTSNDLTYYAVCSQQWMTNNNTATKMLLDGSGNLTVGSADAGNAGTINVSVGAAGTTAGGLQLWAASNQTHYIQFGDGTTGGQPYAGYVSYAHGTDSLAFGTATGTRATISSTGVACFSSTVCAPMILASGCVGINITDPLTRLHVQFAGTTTTTCMACLKDGALVLYNANAGSSTNGTVGIFGQNAGALGLSSGIGFSRESSGNWGTQLRFYTHPTTTSEIDVVCERMRITGDGNVGINTTNFGERLNIGCGGAVAWQNTCNCQKWHIQYRGTEDGLNFVESAVADFRLFLKAGGNVGVGVNPNYKLEVSGNACFTGGVAIGGSYCAFALNVHGVTYQIGGSTWVQNGYGYVNAGATTTGLFPQSDCTIQLRIANSAALTVDSTQNVGLGSTTPKTRAFVLGLAGGQLGAGGCGCSTYSGGGKSAIYSYFGDQFGNGAPYGTSAGAIAPYTVWYGGGAGGYFKGGNGDPSPGGGGAGIVAIGGDGSSYISGGSPYAEGGAGIYARGGFNLVDCVRTWAGYFDGSLYACGNVGIGTTSPSDKLHVLGADNGITICSATANRPVLNFINGSTSMLKLSANGTYGAIASCTGDLMFFYGDKVGIGITSPSFAFEVNSSNNTAITSNNTFGANFNIIFNRDNTGGTRNCFNLLADQNSAYIRTLNNYPINVVTNGQNRLLISNTGITCFSCTVCSPAFQTQRNTNSNNITVSYFFTAFPSTLIGTLSSCATGTTAVAVAEYANLYAYAGSDFSSGIVTAGTRASNNASTWTVVNNCYAGNGVAGGGQTTPVMCWFNGALCMFTGGSNETVAKVSITYHQANFNLCI